MSSFEAKWKGTAEGAKSILGVARELMLVVLLVLLRSSRTETSDGAVQCTGS